MSKSTEGFINIPPRRPLGFSILNIIITITTSSSNNNSSSTAQLQYSYGRRNRILKPPRGDRLDSTSRKVVERDVPCMHVNSS